MRRGGRVLGWLWLAVVAALLVLRFVDLTGPVPMVQSGLPLAGLSLVLLVLIAVLARSWVLGFSAALLGVPFAVLALPWWTGDSEAHRDDDVVVLTANLLYGRAELAEVEEQVERLGVDALVLLEVTEAGERQLAGTGIGELLPHRSGTVREDAGGTLVLTADPHTVLEDPPRSAFEQVPVRVESAAGEWTLLAAHPHPPQVTTSQQWREDLGWLSLWTQNQSEDVPLVVAGDFNASQAHPAFREVAAGMDDAHRLVGDGWVRSWPVDGPVPRFVQLDHVLSRGVTVVDAGTTDLDGSDHRSVWARLRLPSAG